MRNLLRRGIALAAFVVPSTMALTARAESAPLPVVCQLLLAPTDEAIPANAPALVGRQTSQSNATIESTTVVSDPQWPGSFTVVDDTRSPLTKLFVPSQELPAGVELTIEHSLDCTSLTGTTKATFTPSASSPLPTTIGVAKGIAKVEPSADLVKFLPVTMFEAKYG